MASFRLTVVLLILIFFSGISYSLVGGGCCYSLCRTGHMDTVDGHPICVPAESCSYGYVCQQIDYAECSSGTCDICGTCDGLGNCSVPLSCGTPCGTGKICNGNGVTSSSCVLTVPDGGACSPSCPGICTSGVCCSDGKCKIGASYGCCDYRDCPSGQICCSGVCVDASSDSSNCGGCGNICSVNTTSCKGGCTFSVEGLCSGDFHENAVYKPFESSCQESCVNGVCYCAASCTLVPTKESISKCCGYNTTCPSAYCDGFGQKCVYALVNDCTVQCNPSRTDCGYCIPDCTSTCTNCPSGYTCGGGACIAVVASCGNNVCETGESSDNCCKDCGCTSGMCCDNVCKTPVCGSNPECSDGNSCTTDTCQNAGQCNAQCTHTQINSCTSGDGCCPSGCTSATDSDCSASCGNGVCDAGEGCSNSPQDCGCTGGKICCSGVCSTPACSADSQCDDSNSCTKDSCSNLGTCTAQCSQTSITQCIGGDGCCPSGCTYSQDTDCQQTGLCGNGKCDSGVEDCCSCPEDCGVGTCLGDVPGEVCKKYICSGKTRVETYKENCCGNRICAGGEGCGNCPSDCSCNFGEECRNNQCVGKKLLEDGEECSESTECASGHCEFGYCCAAGLCCRKDSECSRGEVCKNYACQMPGTNCSDGTPSGECSPSKPKYCNNENWVHACPTCGCPEG